MIEIREKKAGLPEPEFREEFGGFSVFFDKGKSGEIVLEQLGERLGGTEKNLALIAGDKGIYIPAMAGKLGIGTTAVENNLKSLKSKGTITRTGPLRNQTYVAITRARERL